MQEDILVPSHFFSHTLSDVQNNSKTYVKELLQINDIIILPHPQLKKKLETLTDKVTQRVQQHKHNVPMHSVTLLLSYKYILGVGGGGVGMESALGLF